MTTRPEAAIDRVTLIASDLEEAEDDFLGVDHTAIAISDSASSARFFGSVFGFSTGACTENRGPGQADLDDVEEVHVRVTRLAPDLPAPRLELLHYHVGTRRHAGQNYLA